MRRNRLLLLLALVVAGIIAIGVLPSMMRKLPTRYAMRLPEPLQALALPVDSIPILPTVAAPDTAADLIARDMPPPAIVTSTAANHSAAPTRHRGCRLGPGYRACCA